MFNYNKKKIGTFIIIVINSIIGGIMLSFTHSTMNLWLSSVGVSKYYIGLMSITALPYSFKFIWAGIFDAISFSKLQKYFYHYYQWILIFQIILFILTAFYFLINPYENLILVFVFQFFVCFITASFDINFDAYRIKSLSNVKDQGIGISFAVTGFRIGMYLAGGVFLMLVSYISSKYQLYDKAWQYSYLLFSLLIFLMICLSLIVYLFTNKNKIKDCEVKTNISKISFVSSVKKYFYIPLVDFYKRYDMCFFIIFAIIFARLPDVFIGSMINPFFLEMKYTIKDITLVAKTFGFFVTMFSAYIAAILLFKIHLKNMVIISLILQMSSNIVFITIYYWGNKLPLLFLSVLCENLTSGITTSTFLAYFTYLCKGSKYVANQYALLTSLPAIGILLISPISGFYAEIVSWDIFFITSALLGFIPLFIMLYIFKKQSI